MQVKRSRWDQTVCKILHPHALRVGDEVIVIDGNATTFEDHPHGVIEKRYNSGWGFVGTVIGFAPDVCGRWQGPKPGFYHSPYFPLVRFPEACRMAYVRDAVYIHAEGVMLTDGVEYQRRVDALFPDFDRYGNSFQTGAFVHDLPDTVFWEGDWVRVKDGVDLKRRRLPENDSFGRGAMVGGLNFSLPPKKDPDRDKFCYLKSAKQTPSFVLGNRFIMDGGFYWDADELELVERGHFWKQAHGQQLRFPDLEEEAFFFYKSGRSDRVERLWGLSHEEAKSRVAAGAGHGIRCDGESDGWGSDEWWDVVRFHDDDLGRRVAEATANGFVIPTRWRIECEQIEAERLAWKK